MTETTASDSFADLWHTTIARHRRIERWRAVKARSAAVAVLATVALVAYGTTRPEQHPDMDLVAIDHVQGQSAAGARPALQIATTPTPEANLRSWTQIPAQPVIFDTDMGNSIDDSLALAMIHGYQDRGMVELLAVTVNYANPDVAGYIDAIDTWYGWGDTPIAIVTTNGVTEGRDTFHRQVALEADHDLADVGPAVTQLRRSLAGQADHSVVIVATGFSTNLAQLLASPADDLSPLDGRGLVAAKVKLLAMTAGDFARAKPELNTSKDPLSARIVFDQWPSPIVASEWTVGAGLPFPTDTLTDTPDNPILEAARLYGSDALLVPFPYDPPSFDPSTVLYAVEPDEFFTVSGSGRITLDDQLVAQFEPDPNGRHRLIQRPPDSGVRDRIINRFVELVRR